MDRYTGWLPAVRPSPVDPIDDESCTDAFTHCLHTMGRNILATPARSQPARSPARHANHTLSS
ncbi:MAG: hypothetical protein AB8I80_16280 [Anaerolineae bacterium]